MELSSTLAAIWVVTVILGVAPIWAWMRLNSSWLRPKKLERILRSQGLQGDPYKLSDDDPKKIYMMKMQEEAKSKSIGLLSNDAAPHVFSLVHQTVNKYGKSSFFWEGSTPKVIIMDLEQIKEVFNKMQDFQKPKLTNPIAKLVNTGIISYEGEKWAKHRKIINPAFHLEKLKDMLPAIVQSCNDMIKKWEGMLSSDGACEIDVWPFIQNLTCDVISRTAFGSSYQEGTRIFELLKKQSYLLMTAQVKNIPGWWLLPTATNRKIKEIEREMQASLKAIIEKRETAMKNGESTNEDLLCLLLESNHNENYGHGNRKSVGMTNEEVIEECKLFYLAGQETTSALLVWTLVLLSRFPEWQERARQEILQIFGHETPNYNGLNRLKIVTMILYEVLRLYPPAVYFVREIQKDLKLGNLSLPAGVHVSFPILLIHQDQDIWGDDAMEFKPERFWEGIAKATKGQVSYFPFGWGPRICIGQNFALLEAKMVLSLLLQNFSFQLSAAYTHAPTTVLTLQPKHGTHLILQKL